MSERIQQKIAVIKVGGDMLLDGDDRQALAQNVKDLIDVGWRCVIVHGGGPQLTRLQELHGLLAKKVNGRRITTKADLLVVKQALCGEVNVDLVCALLAAGVQAFGCHGASGALIEAVKRTPIDCVSHGVVDFGEVGDIVTVNVDLLRTLLDAHLVPVIASLGVTRAGRVFNVNADTSVAAIASSLQADLLILSTAVGGIYRDLDDVQSRISEVSPALAKQLIEDGTIRDGMIPKVQEGLALLGQGVVSIAIANAARSSTFLDVSNGSVSVGTRLVSD